MNCLRAHEIIELTQKLFSLGAKGNEQAEIKCVRELLNKFEGVLKVAKEVFENMLKELRSPERYQLFPKEGRNTSEDVPL